MPPGHYRVYAISYRVWRRPDAHERTTYPRVAETVRSNAIEIEVNAADPEWQSGQLRSTVEVLAGKPSQDEARHAARVLRFLNTRDSTRELAKLFSGSDPGVQGSWNLMFGLYGSPYRQIAIDTMRAELAAPDHGITNEFLGALVNLQVSGDAAWDFPAGIPDDEARAFWTRRQAHTQELMKGATETVVTSLARKTGSARALTLHGLLTAAEGNQTVSEAVRPALIAAWADLPPDVQRDAVQYRWPMIAGPDMAPILRKMLAEPPPPAPTLLSMARDAELMHLYEVDHAAGREAILADIQNVKAQPSLEVVGLLSKGDLAIAIPPALKRMESETARVLDYELVDRYAGSDALPVVRAALEKHLGKWACAQQAAMLRYLLRVAPEEGAREVNASRAARKDTGCYRSLLADLGAQFSPFQQTAIDSLDDPDTEVVQNAALALQRWGSKDTEAPLWKRLERFHAEWEGRENELRSPPDYQSPAGRGAQLEQALVTAIASGANWITPPDKLARLTELVSTTEPARRIKDWSERWKGPAAIETYWVPARNPKFSILQYTELTEEQLGAKLAQLPHGLELRWHFWLPGQISPAVSMEEQEAVYERVRADAAAHGVVVEKGNQ